MSTRTPSVGLDHPTVVPANFDPDERDDADAEESAARSDGDRRP
jgi:hypothetical protein